MKKQNNTKVYCSPIQLKLPVDLERIIKINDQVYSFSEVMAHIKHKTAIQRLYEKIYDCYKKLKSYAQKIEICGENRNSYSKTEHDATFMCFKKEHLKND